MTPPHPRGGDWQGLMATGRSVRKCGSNESGSPNSHTHKNHGEHIFGKALFSAPQQWSLLFVLFGSTINRCVVVGATLERVAAAAQVCPIAQCRSPASGRGDKEHLWSRGGRDSTEKQPCEAKEHSARVGATGLLYSFQILHTVIPAHPLGLACSTSINTEALTHKPRLWTSRKQTSDLDCTVLAHAFPCRMLFGALPFRTRSGHRNQFIWFSYSD